MITAVDLAWVALGGGLGSLGRWFVGHVVHERSQRPHEFPLATFLANVSGALVIGFLSVYFQVHWRDRWGSVLSAFMLTGVLGGYTTFSSMQLDAAKLAQKSGKRALAYLVWSTVAGLLAAAVGAGLGRLSS